MRISRSLCVCIYLLSFISALFNSRFSTVGATEPVEEITPKEEKESQQDTIQMIDFPRDLNMYSTYEDAVVEEDKYENEEIKSEKEIRKELTKQIEKNRMLILHDEEDKKKKNKMKTTLFFEEDMISLLKNKRIESNKQLYKFLISDIVEIDRKCYDYKTFFKVNAPLVAEKHLKKKDICQIVSTYFLRIDIGKINSIDSIPNDLGKLNNLEMVTITSSRFEKDREFIKVLSQENIKICSKYMDMLNTLVLSLSECMQLCCINFEKIMLYQFPFALKKFNNLQEINFVGIEYIGISLPIIENNTETMPMMNFVDNLQLLQSIKKIGFYGSNIEVYQNREFSSTKEPIDNITAIFYNMDAYFITSFFFYFYSQEYSIEIEGIADEKEEDLPERVAILFNYLKVLQNLIYLSIIVPNYIDVNMGCLKSMSELEVFICRVQKVETNTEISEYISNIFPHNINIVIPSKVKYIELPHIEIRRMYNYLMNRADLKIGFSNATRDIYFAISFTDQNRNEIILELGEKYMEALMELHKQKEVLGSNIINTSKLVIHIKHLFGCMNDFVKMIQKIFSKIKTLQVNIHIATIVYVTEEIPKTLNVEFVQPNLVFSSITARIKNYSMQKNSNKNNL